MSPPQRYSFVNARPQTTAEKRQTRTAIRSHIGRWTQDKQQKLDGSIASASEKDSPAGTSRTISLSSAVVELRALQPRERIENERSEAAIDESSNLHRNCESRDEDVEDLFDFAATGSGRRRRGYSPDPNSSIPAIQVLGSGTLDPFRTYPSNFPSSLVSQCHQYSLRVLWPGLTPRPVAGSGRPAASKSWFPMALSDPVALHSLLYGALSHQRLNLLRGAGTHVNLDLTSLEADMLRCEVESIALINKAIRKGDDAITDAMIVSVLAMAANEWDVTLEGFLKNPGPLPVFDPLLKSLQWLDIYGLLSPHPVHAAGLVQLIKLRGGLHKIQTPGLAATVFYSGIINASKYLMPPIFPFVPLVENSEPILTLWGWLGTSPSELRDQFVFQGLFDIGLTDELALVLVAMQRYGQNVQLFVDGALPELELDLALFCDKRNLIQHTLLSIPPHADSTHPSPTQPVYEPIRLAMLIYSLTVIFPLPPQTAPIPTLIGQLKEALQKTDLRSSWSSSHQAGRLLIWILVVGSIAARDVPQERSWFVTMLKRLTAKENRVKKFEDLKRDVLGRILWLERSCDAAGRLLWAEIAENGGD